MNKDTMHPEMSTEESLASLGLSTRLSEQMLMMQNPQQAPQDTQNAPQQENTPETKEGVETHKDDKVGELKAEMEGFKTEMKTLVQQQIDGLRQDIQEALKEEDGEN